ncbi:MAG: glucose 1-dehydrogenase [Nevskia sp.]|nr:glucose 1-dehydrogenase [Nevskia sp.]
MSQLLAGKTVLITGAASGIGKAMAEAAANAGGRLVLGDVSVEALNAVTAALTARGVKAVCARCDVRSTGSVNDLVALSAASFGHPDVVFANAGIEGPTGALWKNTEEDAQAVLDVNVMGVWRTFKAVLPGMLERKSGVIVATASVAGLVGAPSLAIYDASKHAVVGLVKSVAGGVAKSGVRVNAVCPGVIDTPMAGRLVGSKPQMKDALVAFTPMGRLGQPSEIANAAVWLGSDQASYVTGHTMVVDGGFVSQ